MHFNVENIEQPCWSFRPESMENVCIPRLTRNTTFRMTSTAAQRFFVILSVAKNPSSYLGFFISTVNGGLAGKSKSGVKKYTCRRSQVLRRQARHCSDSGCLGSCVKFFFASEIVATSLVEYPASASTCSSVPRLMQESKNSHRASRRFSPARSKVSPGVAISRLGQEAIQYLPEDLKCTSIDIMEKDFINFTLFGKQSMAESGLSRRRLPLRVLKVA
jgi:hypothetical protein